MDWLSILRRRKEVLPIDLGKQDISYQAWEVGRVVARILEVFCRLRAPMKNAGNRDEVSALIRRGKMLVLSLKSLYMRLRREECGVFSDIEDLSNRIDHLCREVKEGTEIDVLTRMDQEVIDLRDLLAREFRSRSVHLSNIFNFSFQLRWLKAKLMYDTDSDEIPGLIAAARRTLERLRRGDKVLASPNLEITDQNLAIIDYRLNTITKRLKDLRVYASEQPSAFRQEVVERCDLWTNLILDLLNPSDYLSMKWRFWAKAIPFIICYFMFVTPMFFFVKYNLVGKYAAIVDPDTKRNVAAIALALIPVVGYLYYCVFHYFGNLLMTVAFKCKIPKLKGRR